MGQSPLCSCTRSTQAVNVKNLDDNHSESQQQENRSNQLGLFLSSRYIMTPVLCESFNNNNNSVGVCGKMGDYPEYQEFQKQPNVDNNNNRGPAYQGGFTTTNQHTNFYNTDIAMYESYQESQGEAYSSSLSPKKKGKGGRKKNLHPPTPTIMKHRRNVANARERKRMNGLNDAFERLREVVPNVNTEQKMSKIETLLVAQTYIKALAKLMDSVAEEEEDEMVSRISLRN